MPEALVINEWECGWCERRTCKYVTITKGEMPPESCKNVDDGKARWGKVY